MGAYNTPSLFSTLHLMRQNRKFTSEKNGTTIWNGHSSGDTCINILNVPLFVTNCQFMS